jgi:hypothetical protein
MFRQPGVTENTAVGLGGVYKFEVDVAALEVLHKPQHQLPMPVPPMKPVPPRTGAGIECRVA